MMLYYTYILCRNIYLYIYIHRVAGSLSVTRAFGDMYLKKSDMRYVYEYVCMRVCEYKCLYVCMYIYLN